MSKTFPKIFKNRRIKKNDKKRLSGGQKNLFQVDALEPRVLLSADPVLGLVSDIYSNQNIDQQNVITISQNIEATNSGKIEETILNDQLVYDFSDLEKKKGTLASVVTIDGDGTLGGSGTLDVDLINSATMAPGYSPGVTNVTNYTQLNDGTLELELAGTNAAGIAGGYDQVNVTNTATLDGILDIKIIDGYDPTIGDTFDIINYGDVSGKFSEIKGLFGFKDDYYFEVVEKSDRIQLIVRELFDGSDISISIGDSNANNSLGTLINTTYFTGGTASVEIQADIKIDKFVSLSGTFIFETGTQDITLKDNSGTSFDNVLGTYTSSVLTTDLSTIGGNHPVDGIAIDQAGNIYVSAPEDELIYKITPGGVKTVFAGINSSVSNTAVGDKLAVSFERQFGLKFSSDYSTLYAMDKDNDNIRQIDMSTGIMSNFYDFGDRNGLDGSNASGPVDMAFASNGDAYVSVYHSSSATVWKLPLDGSDAIKLFTTTNNVWGLDIVNDELYVTSWHSSNSQIRKYDLDGNHLEDIVTGLADVYYSSFDSQGRLWWAESGSLKMRETDGTIQTITSGFGAISKDLEVFGDDIYLVDQTNDNLVKVSLDDQTKITTDTLSIAAKDLTVFAGINAGSADQAGLSLLNADFALSIFTSQVDTTRQWVAFNGSAASASMVGLPGVVIDATNIVVELNMQANEGSVIDFKAMSDAGNAFKVSSSADPADDISFLTDGSLGDNTKFNADLDINIQDFFTLNGSFSFERASQIVTLNDVDSTEVTVDLLKVGASSLSAFAGLNAGTADKVGLSLSDVSFGFVFATDQSDSTKKWSALYSEVGNATFSGIDNLTIDGSDLIVEINNSDVSGLEMDLLKSPITIDVGGSQTIDLIIDGALQNVVSVSGTLNINANNFFTVNGGFAFNKVSDTITLENGDTVLVDLLTLGASGASAFAGINGDTADKIGFTLSDVEFALALMTEKAGAKRDWMALKASASSFDFSGINGVTVEGSNIVVEINQKATQYVVDFQSDSLDIATSSNTSLTLDFDGAKKELLQISGNVNINIADFFQINGGFSFSKSTQGVSLSDTSTTTVDLLTVGANNTSAFVGINGGSADEIGFSTTGVNF
ncbi:LEPR-XLL domain-containing protein, partial [bacterium]|nr:LEPR-XLL domain-containing protein [bacterium]